MEKYPLNVARAIKHKRQQDFVHLGVHQNYVSDFERGKNQNRLTEKMRKDIEVELDMVGKIDWGQEEK
jgi:hypothetical protein